MGITKNLMAIEFKGNSIIFYYDTIQCALNVYEKELMVERERLAEKERVIKCGMIPDV